MNDDKLPQFNGIVEFMDSMYFEIFLKAINKDDKIVLINIIKELKNNPDIDKKILSKAMDKIVNSKYSAMINIATVTSLDKMLRPYLNKIKSDNVNIKELPVIKKVGLDIFNKFLNLSILKDVNAIKELKELIK